MTRSPGNKPQKPRKPHRVSVGGFALSVGAKPLSVGSGPDRSESMDAEADRLAAANEDFPHREAS